MTPAEMKVIEVARQHHPVVESVLPYACWSGNGCEHEDECPEVDVVVCSYCYWLNQEINDEQMYDEVLADNCELCTAVAALIATEDAP